MQEAIALAEDGVNSNRGGPFGAVIVKDNQIISRGNNRVTSSNDPTAHAEITAIRAACEKLNTFSLQGCEIYTSCEPCPMCLSAIYWARIEHIYYAATQFDAAKIGFDDQFLYEEMNKSLDQRKIPTRQCCRDEALSVFAAWENKTDKVLY
ncbi:MAG: nucleoside deaminase [Pseudomonadota bacterium]|nr:nucleoside deaminase [Pseudomonadota bacterium]